jgi:hypothetical protein
MASTTRKKPGLKASAEVAKKVKGLTDQFLDCRDPGLRHAWVRENDFHVIKMATTGRRKIEALGRTEVCGRCGTVKNERFINGTGGIEKVGQSYDYPQGYLMPGIPRGVTPSTIVYQEQYRRTMERVAGAARGQREHASR